jgi:hypothetical protein
LRKILATITTLVFSLILFAQTGAASSFYQKGSTGLDVSYPNCSVAIPTASFGVVGVTGGLVYSHNSCLAAQAAKFSNLSLYMNTGLNDSSSSPYYSQALASCNGDTSCAAYTYGFNAANDALSYTQSQGITSAKWWLDVETANSWSSNTAQNQKSLQGAYDALAARGASLVGAYSTSAQWQSVTGGWINNWPNWGATTWTTAKQAQKYCTGHEFTGGPSLLMQYKGKLDQDVAC